MRTSTSVFSSTGPQYISEGANAYPSKAMKVEKEDFLECEEGDFDLESNMMEWDASGEERMEVGAENYNPIVETSMPEGKEENSKSLLPAPSSPSSSTIGPLPRRPIRQSKYRANEILKKQLSTSISDDEESLIPKQEHYCDSEEENNSDDNSIDIDFGTSSTEIKEEPDEDSHIGRSFVSIEDWEPVKLKSDPKPELSYPNRTPGVEDSCRFSHLQFFEPNLYFFNCTFVKFCSEKRLFICQEPDCSKVINGSFLDGSIQMNIRSHVRQKHSSTMKPDGRIRPCPLCSTKISECPKRFKNHVISSHLPYENAIRHVCDICGKRYRLSDITHKWSHRSFPENVAAIQAGEIYPAKLKKKLRQDRDPLYSVVFGGGEINPSSEASDNPFLNVDPSIPKIKMMKSSGKFEIAEKKQPSPLSVVYQLDRNVYLHKYTFFKYSPGQRIFSCGEVGCSAQIPEWGPEVVGKIKEHVNCVHPGNKEQLNGKVRSCPLCSFQTHRVVRFRQHLIRSHPEQTGEKKQVLVVCEICLKPTRDNTYLAHVWRHKSDEDALAAVQAGEVVSTEWKKLLKERKTEPLYSLIFSPTGEGKETKVEKKEEENSEPKTYKYFFMVRDKVLLHKCTLISVEDNQSRLICKEPGCNMSFNGSPMNYYELMDKVKRHVEESHERFYQPPDQPDPSSKLTTGHECPVCQVPVNGALELRRHFFKRHYRWRDKGRSRVICEICWRPILNYNYPKHLSSHMNPEEMKDFESKMEGNDNDDGTPRKIRITDKVSVSCQTCGKIFSSLYRLNLHLPVHQSLEKRKKWVCQHCGKELLSPGAVRSHIERVHKPELKEFKECPVPGCGKIFYKRNHTKFADHMRKHRGETPYICDLCGSRFHSNDGLKNHRQWTHASKSYQCEECGRRYKTPRNLLRHKKTCKYSENK